MTEEQMDKIEEPNEQPEVKEPAVSAAPEKAEAKESGLTAPVQNRPAGNKPGGAFGAGGRGGFRPGGGGGKRRDFRRGGKRQDEAKDEFDQKIIDIARVTRVMAGGKRMRFRACVAIGNKAGKVGIGLAKGADVSVAVNKAVNKARKNIITVKIVNDTIPHEVRTKFGAALILFKPAKEGRGVIAGGAVRSVIELAGIKNIVSKILGTNNKVNNVKCAIEALKSLKSKEVKEKVIAKA